MSILTQKPVCQTSRCWLVKSEWWMLLNKTHFLNVATEWLYFVHHVSAPAPTSATSHIANLCVAPYNKWDVFYDPLSCRHRLNNLKEAETDPSHIRPDQIIFAIRFPHPGLTMTRWFQFIATSVRLEIEYMPEYHYQTG